MEIHQLYVHSQFCEEFDSIVENCVKYNGPDSSFTEKVQRLKVKFYELVQSYLTPDIGASALRKLSPSAAEVEGECSSSEHPSSDEEYNPTIESQSMFEYDSRDQHGMGVDDLLEPSQAAVLLHEWKEKSNEDMLTPHRPDTKAGEMPEFEGAVKVQDDTIMIDRKKLLEEYHR